MYKPKTLFVVGAGASREVGFPIGQKLSEEIADLLYFEFDRDRLQNGDPKFFSHLSRFFQDNRILNEHLHAARQMSKGLFLANSIDNYIDIHQHDPRISLCGKTAIIYKILNAERNSSLFIDETEPNATLDYKELEKTWLVPFSKILFEQVTLDKLDDLFNNIAIICFNYDRCIQHFLTHAINSLYSVPYDRAQGLVEKLKIYHPYGSAGKSPKAGSDNGIKFGHSVDRLDIVDLSSSIKTYTEQVEEDQILEDLRQEVIEAETIVFLGFGFNPQNLSILTPESVVKPKKVLATAIGFSDSDCEDIKIHIAKALLKITHNEVESLIIEFDVRNDLSCFGLFNEYKRTLAAY